MILYPPVEFDESEWLVLITLAGLLFAYYKLPRIFPLPITITIWFFFILMERIYDKILGTPTNFDFYDSMDTGKYDLFDFIMLSFNFPLYGYLFCYFYARLSIRGKWNVLYVLGWSVISTLSELLSAAMHVYNYKNGWNIFHSFLCYLTIFPIAIVFYRVMVSLYDKMQESASASPG